ncbi:Exopolyphosphatase [Candidatus Terasakiella magnetica]|uniref:Exopolyphosphatase n=1 Tax=Candidatus Terasakiella magnetica TaxID=1867952 RepID=A0A1C3RDI2_9PROT|nr:Ppx/GppA family phosphatase [Candidatus Terasakiella magnetica]SCA55350.1 Exopolyphosphatase [Candidatus Terasakiella magnetica]
MMHSIGSSAKGKLTAIVDIGSNTIRLVVFHGPARIPLPVFNEKVQCRLGLGIDETGLLNPKGVELAYESLNRFMKLVEVMEVDHVSLLATAAVREARDGPDFVAQIKQRFDADVRVISGEEEAKLSAYGVLSGLPAADGLLGDMGGASFDLVGLDQGTFSQHDTTPLGHLRISDEERTSIAEMRQFIRKKLSPISWTNEMKDRPFYAVGGSLRAVARLIMHQTDYPLHVIDNFTLPCDEAVALLDGFAQLSSDEINKVPDVSRKRLETLPAAIALLQEVLENIKPSHLVFSGYSMREGQFFLSLSDELKEQDPLLSSCMDLVEREGRFGQQGEEVYDWMSPLFPNESESQKKLRHAACLLHDIAWAEHPDYRADHGFLRVLRLPVAGLSHRERALMAACVYSRYKGDFNARIAKPLRTFLNDEDAIWTKTVGATLRLAHTLASGAPHLLEQTRLEIRGGELILSLPEDQDVFIGEAVAKRVQTIAKHMGLSGRLEHG